MRLIDADKLIYQSHAQHIQPYINKKDIDNAPTVEMAEDCISRESVIEWLKDKDIIKTKNQEENARRELDELPSVTPSRPRGKWIQTKDDCDGVNFYDFSFECSKCGKEQSFKSNYCPNCGADMREVQNNDRI